MFGRKKRQQANQRQKIDATADGIFAVLGGLVEVLGGVGEVISVFDDL